MLQICCLWKIIEQVKYIDIEVSSNGDIYKKVREKANNIADCHNDIVWRSQHLR